MTTPRRDAEQGFSLIEVLVAFIIVTIALTSFYAALGFQFGQTAATGMRHRAIGHAQSHLEAVGQSAPLEPGVSTGTYSAGLRWRMTARELPSETTPVAPPARPFAVTLETFDAGGHLVVRLKTIKLLPVPR